MCELILWHGALQCQRWTSSVPVRWRLISFSTWKKELVGPISACQLICWRSLTQTKLNLSSWPAGDGGVGNLFSSIETYLTFWTLTCPSCGGGGRYTKENVYTPILPRDLNILKQRIADPTSICYSRYATLNLGGARLSYWRVPCHHGTLPPHLGVSKSVSTKQHTRFPFAACVFLLLPSRSKEIYRTHCTWFT